MKITLTGGTGFLGKRLIAKLARAGHEVHLLGRSIPMGLPGAVRFSVWSSTDVEPPAESLENSYAVIHLAGEPVSQRWTKDAKRRILESRVAGTRNVVRAIERLDRKPEVMVCASAIGIYGSRGDEVLTEQATCGTGFLAETAEAWEEASDEAEALGVRVVKVRLGVVLGADGGALAKLLPIFRMGAGGKVGSGKQWMSWIHADDAVRLLCFGMDQETVRGAMNATAPNPVTNAEFARCLGRALHRPAILPVPGFALKLMYGEMAGIILGSTRALPAVAAEAGFGFLYPKIEGALDAALQ